MNHEQRRAKGRTYGNHESLADQSQAADTNINIILKKYGITGTVPGRSGAPQYIDHTELPTDLREAIALTRQAQVLRQSLPEALRDKPLEELTALTKEQLNTILTPPAPPPEPPPGDTK